MLSFDNIMLKAFVSEQSGFISGARVSKIQQPTRRELILYLRNNAQTKRLYINIDPKFYHICFASDENIEKRLINLPAKPPMFCMLLRKYLNNARIAKVIQPDSERILELYFETYNEIGDKIYLCLAIELMGKYSNVILYNYDTNIILGCAHNVGAEKSSVREVYGTIPYTYPPKQSVNNFEFKRYGFLEYCNKFNIYEGRNVNSVIDNYYSYLIGKNKFKELKNRYITEIQHRLKKCEKSLNEMSIQIKKNSDADKYRLYGDLVMSNLYTLKDFSDSVEVYDYENNKYISIKLDNLKTLKENANKFYKKYNKLKTSNIKLMQLTEEARLKKDYLENLLYSIYSSDKISDLKELSDEIESDKPIEKYDKSSVSPLKIKLENETIIYIGKNNKQNDYIVSKLASDEDLWFHTKDCPGSHVLLKTQNVTNKLILECANLAKKYSSASNSSKIGVIYTKAKYLRKPPKANLGYVTYKNEKEIIID